ncbi:putative O-glycosylation ligase, exosortase A system-associated [Rhodocyclaceae bacterium SMB388]
MRDLLLFCIVAGLVPCIFWRPWLGVLTWYWVGLMAPHGLTWGFMQSFPIATLIGGVTLVALLLAKDRKPLPGSREMIMMFVLAGYTAVTSFFAILPSSAWLQWQHFMKILLMTFVTPMLVFGPKRIIWLLLVATFSVAFFGFKGGIFAITTGGAHMVLGPPGSFIQGNTYVGLAMVMVLPAVLVTARFFSQGWGETGVAVVDRHARTIGFFCYGVFWLTAIAILATYSRGALVGLLAIGPFVFMRMKRKGVLVLLAVLAVTVAGVSAPERLTERWGTIKTFEEDQSAMQRIQAWGVNWNMATESPLVGKGFRNVEMGYAWWVSYANFEGSWAHALSPHSIYFQWLGQHGFAGLAVFLVLIAFALLTLRRIQKTAVQQSGQIWLAEYAWALRVGLIGYLVAGAFLDVAYFNLLYAFIALAIIMRRELDRPATAPDFNGASVPVDRPVATAAPRG